MRKSFGAIAFVAGLFALGGCQSTMPAWTAPEAVNAQGIPCLAPLQPGESDPAVRDVQLVVEPTGKASFFACIVSGRFDRLASVYALVSMLPEFPGASLVWLGSGRDNPSRINGALTGMPKLMALVASTTNEPLPVDFRLSGAVAVKLTYQTCDPSVLDRCVPHVSMTHNVVPASVAIARR